MKSIPKPKAPAHEIHRMDGKRDDLQTFLREVVRDFYRRHNRTLPVEVVAARSQVDAVRAALKALDLGNVPVVTTGGCLVGEVWLGLPDGKNTGR